MAPTGVAGLICLAWSRPGFAGPGRPAGACHPLHQKTGGIDHRKVTRAITGGVDTHADVHVAAAPGPVGGLLGVREFPATAAGYACLLDWLSGFGTVCLVGIEGTGSYGAGLARSVTAAGVRVVEVDRSDRQDCCAGEPISSTRSAPPGPRSPAGPAARRRGRDGSAGRSAR